MTVVRLVWDQLDWVRLPAARQKDTFPKRTREFSICNMSKIILIGGSPTAGKSYTARKIAEELKLPWISTDTIREQMREIVRKEDYPNLFQHEDDSTDKAVEFLTHNTAKEIVEHHNKENEDVWRGVVGIIEGDYVWGDFIIEGVAILPKLVVNQGWNNKKDIKVVFLIDEDRERVRNTIYTRGLWNKAENYPDNVKEKEVEWVFEFNNYIKHESKKYNLPMVNIGNRKDYIAEIKIIIQ